MGSLSIWHWLIVLAVVLILFGGSSKISSLMGDFAKGIKSFKKNMADDESMEHGAAGSAQPTTPPGRIAQDAGYAQATGYNPAPTYAQVPPHAPNAGALNPQAPLPPQHQPYPPQPAPVEYPAAQQGQPAYAPPPAPPAQDRR